jgi:hypothetical protein
MNKVEENKKMTFEEVLEDTSLERFHDAIRLLENTPSSKLFPKKHELALTHFVVKGTIDLYTNNPNMPIKKVITAIFDDLTDDIPAPLMLKLTKKIIEKWSKLSTEAKLSTAVAA